MDEYIKRKTAIEIIDSYAKTISKDCIDVYQAIRDIVDVISPAADVVEVVRCKDCQYCEHFFPEHDKNGNYREVYYCNLLKGNVKSTDYCSYGERKDDNA